MIGAAERLLEGWTVDLYRDDQRLHTVSTDTDGAYRIESLSFALPQSLNMMLNQGLVRLDSLMLSFFGVSANAIGVYSLVGTERGSGWLIDSLLALRHGNGRSLVHLYGPAETRGRGGTVTFNLRLFSIFCEM